MPGVGTQWRQGLSGAGGKSGVYQERDFREWQHSGEDHCFPRLDHMFQPAVTGSPVEYSDIEETIAPAVLQEIVNWLNQLK